MTTLSANSRIQWLLEKGLRFSADCSCGSWAIREFPAWDCSNCGHILPQELRPSNHEAEADYIEWRAHYEESLQPWSEARPAGGSSGSGEWSNGHEMFQLPKSGDPENRTAYSLRDYEQKLRKTNLNEDGVTTWDKQPPRFLNPDEKSHW
jgi:hypothetical protein